MSNFGWHFLKLVIVSHCLALEAIAAENVLAMEAEKPEDFSFALTTGISETPVDSDSADHVRILFMKLSGSFAIPLTNSTLIQDPNLAVHVTYSDQIDVEDNITDIENSLLEFEGLGYSINDTWRFTLPLSSTVATNEDDNVYLGYVGSLSVTPGFTYKPAQAWLQGASFFLGSTFSRSFYRFDVSQGGQYNPERHFAPRVGFGYKTGKWELSASTANTTVYLTDGSKLDDTYSSSLGLDYEIDSKFNAGFSWSQLDRTFGYDGSSTNINFRYADLTLLSLKFTYSI
jgi:hypothetical protein